jgi:hypothetical protein
VSPRTGRRRPASAVAALLLLAGCGGDGDAAPSRLLDGSTPPAVPTALDEVDDPVMTDVRTLPPSGAPAVACADRFQQDPGSPIVERIGVDGRSLSFAAGSHVFACDAAAAAREGPPASCGGAAGRREAGAVTDPRLDLANCTDPDGNTVAFVSVEPEAGAAYLGVDRGGWTEVYPVRDDRLPVRVATTRGIDPDRSALRLTVTQYTGHGNNLGKEALQAQVAG